MNDPAGKSPLLWWHAALVGSGIIFSFGYALYHYIVRPEGGDSPLIPLAFTVAGFVLIVYLVRFVATHLRK